MLELGLENLVSSWQTILCCKLERNILVIENVLCSHNVLHKIFLFDVDRKHLASLVDTNHPVCSGVAGRHHNQLVCDALSIDQSGLGSFEHVEVTKFGDDEDQPKLCGGLHQDWKISWCIWSHLDLAVNLELVGTWGWVSNLSDMEALGLLSSFLLTETEQAILVGVVSISHWHLSEAGSIAFQWHGLLLFGVVELDLRVNIPGFVGVETHQIAPGLARIHIVGHYLALRHCRNAVENLDWLGRFVACVDVVHRVGTDHGKLCS